MLRLMGTQVLGPPALEEPSSPPRLLVVAWSERQFGTRTFDPRSVYAERFWLPVLGPTSLWLLRHLAWCLEAGPEGVELDLGLTAQRIGLGRGEGRNSPLQRAIRRLVNFRLAQFAASGELAVLRRVPVLSKQHLSRLDPASRAAHLRWLE
jgi:hypothetical protein